MGLCPALALGRADPSRCHRCAPSSSCMCHHRCRGPTSPGLHACVEHAMWAKAEPFLAQARECGSLPPSSWWPRPRRDVAGVSCAGPKAIRRTLSRTPHTHPPGAHTHTRTSASRKELRGRHTKSWRRRQAGPSCQREEEDADRRDQAVNESREKKKKRRRGIEDGLRSRSAIGPSQATGQLHAKKGSGSHRRFEPTSTVMFPIFLFLFRALTHGAR